LGATADARSTAKPSIMESNWTKAEFRTNGKLQGVPGELVRLANETLARELTISLSAFLRTSIAITHQGGSEIPYGEFPVTDMQCFGMAHTRQNDRKLLLVMGHAVLLPLVGIALGAKAGTFGVEERKPTEIELQVVSLLYRMILADAYRAWSTLTPALLETATLEFDPAPARILPQTTPVFAARFEITMGDQTGLLTLMTPPELFATVLAEEDDPAHREKPDPANVEATLEMLMAGEVGISVWLDGAQMRLGDLLRLAEGQVVRLDHPVERRAVFAVNGRTSFSGQIVSTGERRAFQVEDFIG
jgi:flagellar motor switch protein FliM